MLPAPALATIPADETADAALVLQVVVQNYELYAQLRDRMAALQDWYNQQRELSRKK